MTSLDAFAALIVFRVPSLQAVSGPLEYATWLSLMFQESDTAMEPDKSSEFGIVL